MSDALVAPVNLQLSVMPPARELIERAATFTGQSVDQFAADAVIEKANAVLDESSVRCLSVSDAERFVALLDADVPNDALLAAARRFPSRG